MATNEERETVQRFAERHRGRAFVCSTSAPR
jgi:hypothetical protein